MCSEHSWAHGHDHPVGHDERFAQDYPTRPITMTMPFSAGGPGDTLARVLAQTMTESLEQQVLIENAVGAGGTIGTAKVARSSRTVTRC